MIERGCYLLLDRELRDYPAPLFLSSVQVRLNKGTCFKILIAKTHSKPTERVNMLEPSHGTCIFKNLLRCFSYRHTCSGLVTTCTGPIILRSGSLTVIILGQGFLHMSIHQNCPEGLLIYSFQSHSQDFWFRISDLLNQNLHF